MMHWPLVPSWAHDVRSTLDDAWRSMERLLERGTCRAIGVSNFSIQDLIELMERCSVVPHVSPSNWDVTHDNTDLIYNEHNALFFSFLSLLDWAFIFR